ncbi:hypothetical protein K8I61_05845 [bacterium]|nr:hypothetical protein [bacterium]
MRSNTNILAAMVALLFALSFAIIACVPDSGDDDDDDDGGSGGDDDDDDAADDDAADDDFGDDDFDGTDAAEECAGVTEGEPAEACRSCVVQCNLARQSGFDLSDGPCLAEKIVENWVCDVVHDPREPVDDVLENQCVQFGVVAEHRVEVTPDCELVGLE